MDTSDVVARVLQVAPPQDTPEYDESLGELERQYTEEVHTGLALLDPELERMVAENHDLKSNLSTALYVLKCMSEAHTQYYEELNATLKGLYSQTNLLDVITTNILILLACFLLGCIICLGLRYREQSRSLIIFV